ncbi:MAG: AtzE family amidohydrolase [Leptolyngbyaceae cyanobacterium]
MVHRRNAASISLALRQGETTAEAIARATLDQIEQRNSTLNCFTTVTAERAIAQAHQVDAALAAGKCLGPLAGIPFAVKNLCDIAGEVTLAGSKINQANPPAQKDCTAIARLEAAGAILVGALNMDEYAYGFVTVNHHYGATPNPHDPTRVSGGSSGGSAAAVAAGLVPITLGSDTNGSIRVPATLCGVYGFKPTYGCLSRAGTQLFSASLDHIGPFATTVADIALVFDVLQGPDPLDPVCCDLPPVAVLPQLHDGIGDLRIAIAAGHFSQGMEPVVAQALETVAQALQVKQQVILPESDRARAAAYIITAAEGSQLHLARLRDRPMDFDPATRDRFLAGALIPASWYVQAQRLRRWYRDQVRALFADIDILLAPTTPCVAPKLDQQTMVIDGQDILVRPHLGLYTQPLSLIGLPVLSVPVPRPQGLPVGVQIIAAPYQEDKILKVAAALEAQGITGAMLQVP